MFDEATVVERAALLVEAARPAQALALLGPWLAGHPGSAPALVQAALAHRLLKEPELALSALKTAARNAPDDPYVLLVLTDTLLAVGQRGNADRLARQLVLTHPQDYRVHQMAARAAMGLGLPGEIRALRHARRAVQLAPSDPFSHAVLSRVLAVQGRHLGSRRAAGQARRLAPTENSVLRELSMTSLMGLAPVEAAAGFSAVLANQPDDRVSAQMLKSSLVRAAQLTAVLLFILLILGGAVALVVVSGQSGYDPDAPADLGAPANVPLRVVGAVAVIAAAGLWWRSVYRRRRLLTRWARLASRSFGTVVVYLMLLGSAGAVVALAAGSFAGLYLIAIGATAVTMVTGAITRLVLRRAAAS